MPPTTPHGAPTQPIPLSEIRWWFNYVDEQPSYEEMTKRQKIEAAVSYARCERLDCVNAVGVLV